MAAVQSNVVCAYSIKRKTGFHNPPFDLHIWFAYVNATWALLMDFLEPKQMVAPYSRRRVHCKRSKKSAMVLVRFDRLVLRLAL